MIHIPIRVRVSLSSLRPEKALIDLIGIAGHKPLHCGGGFMIREWEFTNREWADLFAINAKNVPGVYDVQIV